MIPLELDISLTSQVHSYDDEARTINIADLHFVASIHGSNSVLVLDAKDAQVTLAQRPGTPEELARVPAITAAYGGNRWAAFTDDELRDLADDFDPHFGIGARRPREESATAELVAEIERRREAAS